MPPICVKYTHLFLRCSTTPALMPLICVKYTHLCVLSQHFHLLQRMAPLKPFPKGVLPAKGSFGGHNQPGSATQIGESSSSRDCSADTAVSSVSAKMSLQDVEFPPLEKKCTSSPALSTKSRGSSQRGGIRSQLGGPSDKNQRPDLPSRSSKPWGTAMSSRNIHHGADKDDDWLVGADEEDAHVGSRSKKKVVVKSQPHGAAGDRTTAGQDRIYHLGRLLSSILRHKAADYKLEVRNDGYVFVSDLLKLPIRTRAGIPLSAYTVDDIMKAVERDNKQRFTLLTENDVLVIRANQGHSIKTIETEKLLKPIVSAEEISVCVHGTLMRNLDSILKTGLKKMGRNHVHFATGLPREDGVISGMRHTSEVLIYLDAKTALQDGMKLYMSDNGVILTEGFNGIVPPQYFAKIARWKNGKITPLSFDVKTGSV